MTAIQSLAATLASLATPGMPRKDLIAAVRQKHPDASKKEIVQAAFYALTESSEAIREKLPDLHDFALTERAFADEEAAAERSPRKKLRRKASVKQ